MDGVSFEKIVFMDTLDSLRHNMQAQNEAVMWKVKIDKDINNESGPVYNIDYDRKPLHMIDNQLRQDTRINENRNRELKEKLLEK